MPQVQQENLGSRRQSVSNDAKPLRQRLAERFEAHEFVRVKNIDDEDFEWQYMPTSAEEESFTDNGAVRVVNGRRSFTPDYQATLPGNEQIWMLPAGETEVLLGENAYLFIDGLYKRLVAKKVVAESSPDHKKEIARNFNWSDGSLQDAFIDKILIGKESPTFRNAKPTVQTK